MLVALLLHGFIILIEWYVVSPIGLGGTYLLLLEMFFFFLYTVIVLAVPVSLLFLFLRKTRRHGFTILASVLVYILIGFILLPLSSPIRMNGFHRLTERSEPLVSAIHHFVEKEGRPPDDLEELVPDYIPLVPKTGMPAYPTYQYSTETNSWDGNPWVLYIICLSGKLKQDKFMYFPKQNYLEENYGGTLERIGKWAYVHK